MRVSLLLVREIAHHKLMFLAGLVAVGLSVGIAVGSLLLLRAFDRDTEVILQAKEVEVDRAWAKFRDDTRKTMLELGFNLVILHADQNLSTPDEQAKYLPADYADRLAAARLMTINHILPFLKQKVWWPERKRWVTLYGTPGEVRILNEAKQKPMVRLIQPGHASLGRGIHEGLGLSPGDRLTLLEREFVVEDCRPAEGFEEDEQVRIPLAEAQQMLDKKGLITGLMAINCICEDPEGMSKIRAQVAALLPDTQVREHKGNMVVRAEERSRAARETETSLARERKSRETLRAGREEFYAILVPLVTLVAAGWLALITWMNVRHRRGEIAILRAIGWTNRRVFALFIGKAALTGLVGGCLGYAGGLAVAAARAGASHVGALDWRLAVASIVGATALAILASWVPALLAGRIDPAVVLQQE